MRVLKDEHEALIKKEQSRRMVDEAIQDMEDEETQDIVEQQLAIQESQREVIKEIEKTLDELSEAHKGYDVDTTEPIKTAGDLEDSRTEQNTEQNPEDLMTTFAGLKMTGDELKDTTADPKKI